MPNTRRILIVDDDPELRDALSEQLSLYVNWDGIVPEAFPHLIPYLKSRGVEIKLNARGRIDWPT